MEFVHRSYERGQTIAAVATPPGEGGIAIIRISGDTALDVANAIFSGDVFSYKTHTAHYGTIVDPSGATLDEVLLLVMKAPKSFTGEDVVEIHCHGGTLITRKVLQRVLQVGARAALPGEFSFKAFMNGKLDLAQAEAIQELIAAKNERALHTAQDQLQGALTKKIILFQHTLTHIAAIFEAWVDYPEEGLEFASDEEILLSLNQLLSSLKILCKTYYEGKILKEGISLCMIGAPNVGKSSLMNALSGKERSIVTNIPGTTRDTVHEELSIGDLHFTLTDTAGIRETEECIEQEGIKRSFHAAQQADLVLLILDVQRGWDEELKKLLSELSSHRTLLVWNKIDTLHATPQGCDHPHQVFISAETHKGLDTLKEAIRHLIWHQGVPLNDQILITSQRHHQALLNAIQYLENAMQGLQTHLSPELLSMDVKAALKELGTIIGTNITEDVLSAIFSKFCVGK
jgi:tRNA modification GTPase